MHLLIDNSNTLTKFALDLGVVQVGDEVEVMVLDIDEERRRISLGIKPCKGHPWEELSGPHSNGAKIKEHTK